MEDVEVALGEHLRNGEVERETDRSQNKPTRNGHDDIEECLQCHECLAYERMSTALPDARKV
jgi:hypothetical protein